LQDERKPYPRSSCTACGKSITTGLGNRCSVAETSTATALTAKDKEIEALRGERDDALSRVEELELSAEVVSDEFEKDCWKAMRRLLNECKFDWSDVDQNEGISAEDAFDHAKTTLDELEATGERWKARAETAERNIETKDKEIEALRADCQELRLQAICDLGQLQEALGRAETAERRVKDVSKSRDFYVGLCQELRSLADTAERERDRIADELDTMNDNHRVMAKLLADTGRERDEARAALKPMIPLAEDAAKKLRQCGSPMADKIDQLARAARTVIEQGE
jgi:chromosome segregation ATPase